MKTLFLALLLTIIPVSAKTIQGTVSETARSASTRQTPFLAVNYGVYVIKLGQETLPDLSSCDLFYIGTHVYVFQDDILMGCSR